MRTGLKKINGNTYYFGTNGKMRTGKIKINGKVYDFGKDGALVQPNSNTSTNTNTNSATLMASDVLMKIKTELGDSYTCNNVCDDSKITNFLDLDMSEIESYAYENNAISAINMDTAIILKVKDGYADEAAKILQERFNQTGRYSLTYGYDKYRTGKTFCKR